MNERDENLLNYIKEEAELLIELTDGCDLQGFLDSELLKRTFCMTLINIGESVKLLSKEFKQENKDIPWRFIAGLRDITAHGYQTLDMLQVWKTVTENVPELLEQVKGILHAKEAEAEK
ncbi:MAG: DUF86 domain-containing protein [Methanomicrobiales archaeon]|jgi:uncharacterized protein with HEPN domain|nr:DUF86 domain-containing protein [Methanomicrobiales archaeon]